MKPFLDISKGRCQQEIILAVILACPIIGILLLFGLGLSDATQQERSKTCQIRINYSSFLGML